ncbi:hypothetical protein A1Q2_04594 [Trichosporon asahii var. asahii CBS 8904]|uniref:Uncharacterized protein n=2 Tax=Trichosporon asahii var. asahii TaxID=189963 RepID=K1VK23_TRIAC|nr:hypothetical protein A1Q1_00563 [Trichosporon asahii var. asahii CBS 2479]EJT50096.1 hypothetical protein A1Q1_00563 [Trichosporon asahii var. asahii CBS 2479]EKD01096.1 hypothetical protein A1Q2_04594 [Trichosporon asahii var. asahii CBS 8904]
MCPASTKHRTPRPCCAASRQRDLELAIKLHRRQIAQLKITHREEQCRHEHQAREMEAEIARLALEAALKAISILVNPSRAEAGESAD